MRKETTQKERKLTQKEEMFCREYLIDFNGTQAYIRAGFKVKNDNVAKTQASKLLTKATIEKRLEQLKAERNERVEINADWVLKEAVSVYRMAKGELPCVMGYTDKEGKTQKVDIHKTNLKEANRALEIIGKHVSVKAFDKELDLGDGLVVFKVTAPKEFEQHDNTENTEN